MSVRLERTAFEISRAAEYFDARQLSTLTGVPTDEFAHVVLNTTSLDRRSPVDGYQIGRE